jgi:hypothetical protein
LLTFAAGTYFLINVIGTRPIYWNYLFDIHS